MVGQNMLPKKDRAYNESRFSEVREAIVANSYQKVWGRGGESALPNYEVTLLNVCAAPLPFGRAYQD